MKVDVMDSGAASERHPARLDGPAKAIARILSEARERFGMEVAFVSEFDDGRRVFRFIEGNVSEIGLEVGGGDPLELSYCHRIVVGDAPCLMRDARKEPSVADLEVTHKVGIGAHMSVPIVFSDGRIYGTFCCFSRSPNEELAERDIEMIRAMAALVVDQLEEEDLKVAERRQTLERIRRVMDEGRLTMVFQPIVCLADGSTSMVEALTRVRSEPFRTPDLWFAEAWAVGVGLDLELHAVQEALSQLGRLPRGVRMSVNISPETALSPRLKEVLAVDEPDRLVIELTEHDHVADYVPLKQALMDLRGAGPSIAIDDVGTGYSGLQRLLELQPDILKLDTSITSGLDVDPVRRSLAAAVVSFSDAAGLSAIAEGVETPAEAQELRTLSFFGAQGYLFGRPGPLDLSKLAARN